MDKDTELEEMMHAIKNLKEKDTKDMNINNLVPKETEKNDTSFYSRIFHHNKTTTPPKQENGETQINLQKQLDDYFASVEFNTKVEKIVQNCLLSSVQNQIYMNQLLKELIKEYTSHNELLEKQANTILREEIIKILKNCSTNIANTLKSV